MRNIFIVVEGYAELEFVKKILAPHLIENGVTGVLPFVVATNANLGKKGGGKSYKYLKKDLLKSVIYNPLKIVTTFFDYYAFPSDAPGRKTCAQKASVDEKIACLETAIKNDIAPHNPFFIPYLQKHEFEALLFSSNIGFENYFSHISEKTQAIIDQYQNPEDINDSINTAPSKRLINFLPEYKKAIDGEKLASAIGLKEIVQKCPRFRNWVETLIAATRGDDD